MKKMFIVSAIMLFAAGAMTSCKDDVANGCTCTSKISYMGQEMPTEPLEVEGAELKERGYKTCAAFAKDLEKETLEYLKEEMGDYIDVSKVDLSVSCKAK